MADGDRGDRPNQQSDNQQPQQPKGFGAVLNTMKANKLEVALWATRVITIVATFGYIFPLFVVNPYSCYQKALLSNAATSALRLHQRLPTVRLNREFFALLLLEDSCHYLFYSIIFVNSFPITLVLLPVFLFATLHASSYSLNLLDQLGQNSWWGARFLISIVEYQQRNILRLIAFTEIFLMPFAVIMIFMGKVSILVVFVYYRFMTLRYASRRNPYTRQVFSELRYALEMYCNKPSCPQTVRNLGLKLINFVSRMAPPVAQ